MSKKYDKIAKKILESKMPMLALSSEVLKILDKRDDAIVQQLSKTILNKKTESRGWISATEKQEIMEKEFMIEPKQIKD